MPQFMVDSPLVLLASGIKIPAAAATAECLATTPIGTRIWVGSMFDPVTPFAGNTDSVFVGNADGQHRPLTTSNWEGFWLPTGDPNKVFVKQKPDGDGIDGVNYEIWGRE
jgi:hypothetical protein